MRFFDQRLILFARRGLQIQWEVEPEDTDLSNVEVEIQRSESPSGPFTTLRVVDILTTFGYVDKTAPLRPQEKFIYYRLVARDKSTGDLVHQGKPFNIQGALPLDALEIIRQHRLLLEGVNGHSPLRGIPCTVYKRRNFGPPCRNCRDAITGRIIISNCSECSGTGVVKGYYEPVDVLCNVNPHPADIRLANVGKIEDSGTQVFLTNFPILYPGDVIVEPDEKHWRVVERQVTERKRTIVHQLCPITQLKPDDITHETLLHSSNRSST